VNERSTDRQLQALFKEIAPPLADDGFSQAVQRRIRRRRWWRPVALAAGLIVGSIPALPSLWELAAAIGRAIAADLSRWLQPGWLFDPAVAGGAVLLLLALPALLYWQGD